MNRADRAESQPSQEGQVKARVVDGQVLFGQDRPEGRRINSEAINQVGERPSIDRVACQGQEADSVSPGIQPGRFQVKPMGRSYRWPASPGRCRPRFLSVNI